MGASLPFLLSVLLWATPSATQKCDIQPMANLVINISEAVSRGTRFTDPINVAGPQECVSACCTQLVGAGDRPCNLAVYDGRKNHSRQNCYLFHCPRLDSCPMSPRQGVLSYSLWKENSDSDPAEGHLHQTLSSSRQNKTLSSARKKPGSAPQPPGSAKGDSDDAPGPQDLTGKKLSSELSLGEVNEVKPPAKVEASDTPERIASQLLHLAADIDKRLEKIESKSQAAKVSDSSLQAPDAFPTDTEPALQTTIISMHGEPKRLPSDAKKAKATVKEKQPMAVEVHHPTQAPRTPDFVPARTSHRPVTVAPKPIPHTKANLIATPQDTIGANKVPSSDVKSKVLTGHHGTNPSNIAVRTTAEYVKIGHPKTHRETPAPDVVHPKTQPERPIPDIVHPKTHKVTPAPDIVQPKISIPNLVHPKTHPKIPISDIVHQEIPIPDTVHPKTHKETPSPGLIHPKTYPDIPIPDIVHRTRTPLLVTRPAVLRTPPSKASQHTLTHEGHPSTNGKDKAPEQTLPEPNSSPPQDPSPPAVRLEEAPIKLDSLGALPGGKSPSDDRSGLVAALIFGVVFLIVVIGLVSRKVSEARQRHQYTKLDYLINGMYVDT
ncbi:MANSC domain-containing protein 1 [Pseudophryne corroboree]|uniref:MANSC domain-containing protein 1 n=1 Tax=Pseudophryne corroboree TaxID=495146 RepID=UPI0030816F33